MKLSLIDILNESKGKLNTNTKFVKIGGDIFYKKEKGEDTWSFTDETDFYKNSNSENTIEYN